MSKDSSFLLVCRLVKLVLQTTIKFTDILYWYASSLSTLSSNSKTSLKMLNQDKNNNINNSFSLSKSSSNPTIQSKVILQKIIRLALVGRENIKTNFKYWVFVNGGRYNSTNKPFTINKELFNYAFVCKEWCNIISNTFLTEFILRYPSNESTYLDLQTSVGYLSNSRSLYQLNSIKTLYCYEVRKYTRDEASEMFELLSKFSNLERLYIFTGDINLIRNIIKRKPSFKIRLYFNQYAKEVSLFDLDYSVLERVTLVTRDLGYCGDGYDFEPTEQWRVNKIYFDYEGAYDEDGDNNHIAHDELFAIESLKSIDISDFDYVDIKELKLAMNDHLESFRCSSILSMFGYDEDEDLGWTCRCIENSVDNDYEQMISDNNQTDDWIEFCQRLSKNKTLKHLKLSNFCSEHKIDDQSILKLVSDSFVQSLALNTTLSRLEISCDILDESFYTMFSNNRNTTIYKLTLFNLNSQHLQWTTNILKFNNHINSLDIESYIIPHCCIYTDIYLLCDVYNEIELPFCN
ncbi:hypothetical protein PPL_10202 [Heterostelium album PN500]|uniref:F-box domain-containing protein n=1 Tax=Heterostelium pallidum (strain ATCC 26659 / Pp 5 / PN500) TaxID=670386 RepID=D3BQL7_HETP5|nr:hypothetical protein PPL_10202 [Heterostelium album PN500]EFA76437.1 hypothetical protein PPL_10202 [Heterostelium album PN500]|eukprot:XP_020428569.1 hypothetical protein PPL_10202 [Heterostelium album PN500]